MQKYLAILSKPYDNRQEAKDHIARTMSNGPKRINRSKLFTLYVLSRDRKYYVYRVCRIITEKDIINSGYCDLSKESWVQHLEAHTDRVVVWLEKKSTKIIEKNKMTLSMMERL